MIKWNKASVKPASNSKSDQMTDRLLMWCVFNGEDINEGRAIFGAYNFISENFFAVENDMYKKLMSGKAEITHWKHINTPAE